MDIQPRTTVAAPIDDKAWLIDDHGIDSTLSGTVVYADFGLSAGDVLPGGTPIALDGSSGTYKPVFGDDGAGGVEQTQATGHVYESILVGDGDNGAIAVLWHGAVAADRVPVPEGETFDADLGSKHCLYV